MDYRCPYRTPSRHFGKRKETVRTIKNLIGRNGPLLDGAEDDRAGGQPALLKAFEKLSDLVTDWYLKYLAMEVRRAAYYEDAIAPASLLAFSMKPEGVERLGGFLGSRQPLQILVAMETLGDLVALGPDGESRSLAVYFLESSRVPLAKAELEDALRFSDIGYPSNPYVPLRALPPVPLACLAAAASRYCIPM